MGAELNIESDDAYRPACRLSELTGESLTDVVIKALSNALEAELEPQQRTRDIEARVEHAFIGAGNPRPYPGTSQFRYQLDVRRKWLR